MFTNVPLNKQPQLNMKKKWIFLLLAVCLMFSCSGNEEQSLVLNSEADLAGLRIATQSGSCYGVDSV